MIAAARSTRMSAFAAALGALALAGCADGVELNGKLFDALGVSEAAQRAGKNEPKMRERTGLVVPPDVNRLPEPGSGNGEPDVAAQLNDPDRRKVMAAAERARQHKLYCSGEMTWKERVNDRDAASKTPQSPYGPCSLLGEQLKQ